MANVLFTRDSLTNIENPSLHPVTDGQLLFDTSGSGKMYMDVGTQRLEMGGAMTIDSKLNSTSTNPIQNKAVGGVMLSTLDEINATTSKGFITDALATRALAQKVGTTDISSIGDGTCTGAISALNANLTSEDRINIKVNVEAVSLNSAERTGIYYVTGDNIQGLPSGFSTYGLLFVMRSPYSLHPTNKNSVYSQLYIDVYNNRATRAFNNGAWTDWKNF